MNRLLVPFFILASAFMLVGGCPSSAPLIPQIADCGPLTATVKGRINTLGASWSSPPKVPALASLSGTGGGAVTWTASSAATATTAPTGSAMDGTVANGTATGSTAAPTFTATGSTSAGGTLTVSGAITKGQPCTGNGNWTLNTAPPSSGTWTIP